MVVLKYINERGNEAHMTYQDAEFVRGDQWTTIHYSVGGDTWKRVVDSDRVISIKHVWNHERKFIQ